MYRAYPVIVETDQAGGYSAYFPDLPGLAAAGDSIESCHADALAALALHLAGMIEDGDALPAATPLQSVVADPDSQVAAILLASAPVTGRTQRVNITLDATLLAAIDQVTTNRSAWLADAALAALRRPGLDGRGCTSGPAPRPSRTVPRHRHSEVGIPVGKASGAVIG